MHHRKDFQNAVPVRDDVDVILERWQQELPEFDASPMGTTSKPTAPMSAIPPARTAVVLNRTVVRRDSPTGRGDAVMSTAGRVLNSQSYRERLPGPQLAGMLSCVWILQVSTGAPAYEHRTVPNGCIEIAGVLDTGLVRVAGPRRKPTLEQVSQGVTVVGVRFRPGVAPAFLGLPAGELVDLELDLDLLWGQSAVTLGARLAEAASPEDAAIALEQEIVVRSAAAPGASPLVTEAVKRLQPWRAGNVSEVTRELFISPRQVRRHFVAALGYGPKTLQRILRFQGFLALCDDHHAGNSTLSRLAAAAGYADQAHLTRECSQLTGLTPSAFLDEMVRSCVPTHDHAPSFAPLRRALLQPARR